MIEQQPLDIERQRFRRHYDTIGSMGYLIVLLVVFSVNPFGNVMVQADLRVILLALFLLLITLILRCIRSRDELIPRRILINTVVYIVVITAVLWISEESRGVLFFLYYLVFIGALLTLSRLQLLAEIGLITFCLILVIIHRDFSVAGLFQSLVYHLVPFWVFAYVAAEIYQQSDEAKRQLSLLSLTDPLTGLWNMRTFISFLDREIERAERYNHVFGLMMLDIDNLKVLNDTHGHLLGSELIKQTSEIIVANLRKTDIASRYGGDEFILLLPETHRENAIVVAERICRAVHEWSFRYEQMEVRSSISIGISSFPQDGKVPEDIISGADKALYRSKKSGKNRVSVFNAEIDKERYLLPGPEESAQE